MVLEIAWKCSNGPKPGSFLLYYDISRLFLKSLVANKDATWCFAENRYLRGHMMFRKNLNGTSQTVRNALLVFIDLHFVERNAPKNFLWYSHWFWMLPLTHVLLEESCYFCSIHYCYWFMLGVCYWIGLLVSLQQRVESPPETTSKQVY